MARFQTLELLREGAVAEIRLVGPATDARMHRELDDACAEIHDDAAIIVVLVTAANGGFARDEVPANTTNSAFRCIELMGQPAIAAIEGDAIGAGLELALACDIRVAGEGARFAMPQVAHSHIPSAGGTQRLPRVAGLSMAAEMILLGEPIDATAALRCGLVNALAPDGSVRARALEIAGSIAKRGPLAVRYAKEAVLRGPDMPLPQALRYETDLTVILQTTADRAEGVRAFLEKRPPVFEGK